VAVYARVSTEEQREGQTIDSQIAELIKFTQEKGWAIVRIYKDEGWSGSLLARPALDRLRDDAAHSSFSILLVNDVDRLARDVSHLGIIKRHFERCGVQLIFRKLPAERSPTYNLMVNILGSFAEFERELIADRTRRGRRHKVEARQQFLGCLPPYGYRYIRKDDRTGKEGYLEVNPEEAVIVKQMFEWVDREGLSARKVVERLKEIDVPPKKQGRKWAKSSVLRILRNEIYAGVWYYNKHESFEPDHPTSKKTYRRSLKSSVRLRPRTEWLPVILPSALRIVDREQWERVQIQLTRNTAFSNRNTKHNYLLTGLLRCGACNAPYVGDPNHGKFYYRCSRRCKKLPAIRDCQLDETIWSAVEEAILNPSLITECVANLGQRVARKQKVLAQDVRAIDEALEQIRIEEARILEAYRLAIISAEQLREELAKVKTRKTSLETRKGPLVAHTDISPAEVHRSVTDYCQVVARRLKAFSFEERRSFLRLLLDEIRYEGHQVRIKGVIPVAYTGQNRLSQPDSNPSGDNSRSEHLIAAKASYPRGRKRVYFEFVRLTPIRPFSIMSVEGLTIVRRLAEKLRGRTLQEWCDRVEKEHGVRVSLSSMDRALLRLGIEASRISKRKAAHQGSLRWATTRGRKLPEAA
jgi:site-specific DNA recombinase